MYFINFFIVLTKVCNDDNVIRRTKMAHQFEKVKICFIGHRKYPYCHSNELKHCLGLL